MGRPRNTEPRDAQLNFSLTKSELENIRRRAEAVGMRPVHFGRALLFSEKHKSPPNSPGSNVDKLIYGQLVRLGNNLNQLVRRLHSTGEKLPSDLEPLLSDIRTLIAKLPR